MERYFIVNEGAQLHDDYFKWSQNQQEVNEFVKKFFDDKEIEANEYYVSNESIHIVPTEKDTEKFNSVLGSTIENGLRKFKGTSKVHKSWIKVLKENNLKVIIKPRLILYLKSSGRFRSRLFDQDGKLYCSIDPYSSDIPEGFTEIKGSEFFKVIEDRQAS